MTINQHAEYRNQRLPSQILTCSQWSDNYRKHNSHDNMKSYCERIVKWGDYWGYVGVL